jgi:Trp operon repressor
MVHGAPLMFVDVMTTNADDQEKKICQLVLSKDDLLQILNRVQVTD